MADLQPFAACLPLSLSVCVLYNIVCAIKNISMAHTCLLTERLSFLIKIACSLAKLGLEKKLQANKRSYH